MTEHWLQKKSIQLILLNLERKFCLSLHYNEAYSYLLINGIEINEFKAKDSGINAILLCLRNILKDFSVDNIKNTWLNGYVYVLISIMMLMILVI